MSPAHVLGSARSLAEINREIHSLWADSPHVPLSAADRDRYRQLLDEEDAARRTQQTVGV